MNAGLSNLATLKAHVLAAGLAASTDYDTVLTALGRGVAGRMERHCNRFFLRTVDTIFETDAEHSHLLLPRAPIEAIESVEQRDSVGAGWIDITENIQNRADQIGLLHFGGILGSHLARVRVTYTGGYWWETLEPDDDDYPTTQPDGSTALPSDLQFAWLLQCERVWDAKDKHGLNISAEKPDPSSALSTLELVPEVKSLLNAYIRYAIT